MMLDDEYIALRGALGRAIKAIDEARSAFPADLHADASLLGTLDMWLDRARKSLVRADKKLGWLEPEEEKERD